jgi:flagellar biosynthetic protein FlhB
MADNNQGQEKTEQPTPKRKSDARKEGQVAKSTEVNTAVVLLGGVLMLLFTGQLMFQQFVGVMREMFGKANTYEITPESITGLTWDGSGYVFKSVLPFFMVMLLFGLAASLGQVGIKITPEAMKPKWSKLNVFKGMKNLFSSKALFELVKNLLKMLIVLVVTYFVIRGHSKEFFVLADQGVAAILKFVADVGIELTVKVVAIMLIVAGIDLMYQKYKHNKDMMMTKQEVKEEHKQVEGDPMIKARIRRLQQDMSRNRMMGAVPEADVVITNPTHYAIAVKYDGDEMEAPIVVAKGIRKMALRIKEIAKEHDIPTIENPPLARSLYKVVEVDEEIPSKFYQAIAEVLAQIYKMKKAN